MEPFIDLPYTRLYYLGHHKNWGLNGVKLLGRKRPPEGLLPHEFRRLERATRKQKVRHLKQLPKESNGGTSMD